ncbi:MAG: efflux RND transporter periplasmic adaptor subunit [Alphaproteobacteria bacterium]|nr:efflux RND transporter periplasmic adaptor subunit [Alphaproteobacteria bacterium]
MQNKPKGKKTGKIIFVLLLLCAAGFGGYRYMQARKLAQAQAAPQVVTVTKGDLEQLVTAQGKLEPKTSVDVGVQVSGQIKKLYVELGDDVKKGDPIADIDPQVYLSKVEADKARVKTLQAQIVQQEAQVKLAQQQFARNEKLLKTSAVSQDAYDSADTALKVAKAQKDALEAQLEEEQSTLSGDQANLGYAKIYAPMDGTVVVADIKEGQTVNAVQSAPTIVQLADLDTMTVEAQVAEADIMSIKPGMEVYFTTLGAQGRRWTGAVRQILPTPEVINEVVLYDVLVDVDNKDRQLMSGMSTQTFFVLGRAKDAPLIPVAALGKRMAKKDTKAGMAYRVYVAAPGGKKPEARVIHIGLQDRAMAEVKDGLKPGDKIYLEAPQSDSATAGGAHHGMRGMAHL